MASQYEDSDDADDFDDVEESAGDDDDPVGSLN
jgi:hypothetical protein